MSVDEVRAVLAAHLPGERPDVIVALGAGTDNVAYLAGDLVVRFRRDDPADVGREARLLRLVAAVSPVPVPVPVVADERRGCLVYRRLPGVPLIDVPTPDPATAARIGAELGEFLAALHAVPPERVAGLVEDDDTPPAVWLADAAGAWPAVAAHVPVPHRGAVEAFLAAAPPVPATDRVFSHADLGIEHVLVDPSTLRVSGIIDWADAAVGDPAYDMGLVLRDLGPGAHAAAVRAAGRGDAPADRAAFFARCGLIEDWAYGLDNRRVYADKSRTALAWLFPVD